MDLLQLAAHLRRPPSDSVVAHRGTREALRSLMPETALAGAWAEVEKLERETGCRGIEALRASRWLRRVEAAEPGRPQPVTDESLLLAARLLSPEVIVHHEVREELGKILARGPLAPSVWRMRDLEWAARTPPPGQRNPVGLEALDLWAKAGQLVDALLAEPRPLEAAGDPWYHKSLVVHQLLDRDRTLRSRDPRQSVGLAQLAAAVAQGIVKRTGADWPAKRALAALAFACLASAYRIVGNVDLAAKCQAFAQPFLHGQKDPRLRGTCLLHIASTFGHLFRFGEARNALAGAMAAYEQAGDGHSIAKVLMLSALIDNLAGELGRESLQALNRAFHLADPNRDPVLPEAILLNLARYQAEAGLTREAEATLATIPPFAEPVLENRRKGISGLVDLAERRWGPAYVAFSDCAEALCSAGHRDGALYRLMAAIPLIATGRLSAARCTVKPLAEFFLRSNAPAVATAARLVCAQVEQGELQVAGIRELVRALELTPGFDAPAPGSSAHLTSPNWVDFKSKLVHG